MYEIRPESLKTFITANNIRLPRFQRKQTWDAKKNFELCISVFKNYPIGVSILSVDESRGSSVRWLLDGRQRRNALKLMFEDPENVYYWAQKFIKFRNGDQPHELQEKYWDKVNEFLETEPEDEQTQEPEEVDADTLEVESIDIPDEVELQEESTDKDLKDLSLLFEIIRLCHNKSKKGTGFTLPFDFTKYGVKMPYNIIENGQPLLSSKKLRMLLNNYITFYPTDFKEEQNFKHFIEEQCNVDMSNAQLEAYIHRTWPMMVERMYLLQSIDNLFSTQTIGLIEVKNLKPADSQKIFNLINSQGSPLKAVEILSARPKWNLKIDSPSGEVKQLVQDLYRTQMDIVPEGVVRWDMAATFLRRIQGENFVFKKFDPASTSDFEKELTMAFKCLSGIYVQGVTKIDIDNLADHPINWETDIDRLVNDSKNMFKVLGSFPYFKFLKSWNVSIQDMTSDAIALDFFILSYSEWERQNCPMGSSAATKNFQKFCFKLWDRLIYEYVWSMWKGSSDSRVHGDIVNTEPQRVIATEKWVELLEGIYVTNKINDRAVIYGYMQPILYHVYALRELKAPSDASSYDIDHILPQVLIKNSSLENKDEVQDNLFNLALLPKTENVSKGGKKLTQIDDPWLKSQIKDYEFVEEKDYARFSDVSNYKQLFEHRKKFFMEALKDKRTYLLNN